MSKIESLISGFNKEDSVKIDLFLQKLLPHLAKDKFMIVGGLAIRYYLTKVGVDYPIREFNDLDIKAESTKVLASSVTNDFLIYHYHPENNGAFYIVLIDPETKIKVDIFDMTIKDEQFVMIPFHEWNLRMVRLEDQFVKTVFDIQRISKEKKVDPKQFLGTRLMTTIVNMDLADEIWKKRHHKELPNSIRLAVKRAQKIAEDHPEWTQERPFRHEKPYYCPDCIEVKEFPITPMSEIYKVLGYTE